jgi:hypothetical protein
MREARPFLLETEFILKNPIGVGISIGLAHGKHPMLKAFQ